MKFHDLPYLPDGLSAFASDATSELNVLWHDGDALRVNGAQVGVFEQADQISFAGLLERHHRGALEAQVGLEVLGDLTNETLERKLADEELGALLVATDFTKCHRAGPVTMGFLHAAGGRCALTRSLGGQLLARCLTTGGFASSLFRTSHCDCDEYNKTYNIIITTRDRSR